MQVAQQQGVDPSLLSDMFSSEQLFVASLEQLISSSGTTQQHCIAQLRSLGLPDDFWMYVFKVVPCAKTYSHKWTLCPCAHAGETARRRDPRVVNYRAVLCPIVKGKKTCPLGDSCSYAHNVFEHWLHPSRYKTRLCSFGRNCNRPICFFAHSAEELRMVPNSDDGKEVDEREYMLQVMMAQQNDGNNQTHSGLLNARSLGSISSPATPNMNGIHSLNAFCSSPGASQNPYASLIDPLASPLPSPQPSQHMSNSAQLAAAQQISAQQAHLASYLNASPIRVKPTLHHQHSLPAHLMAAASGGLQMNDALQLMGLQEALAAMNLHQAMDGGMPGSHSLGATPHSNASRTSDPGLPGPSGDALKMLNGMTMNRISESGQSGSHGLGGLTSPKGLVESLLPYMSSALQQQQQQQQVGGTLSAFGNTSSGSLGNGTPAASAGSASGPSGIGPASGNAAGNSSGMGVPGRSQSPPPSSPGPRRTSSPASNSSASGSPPNQHLLQQQQSQQLQSQGSRGLNLSDLLLQPSSDMRLSDMHPPVQRQLSDPAALMNFSTPRAQSHRAPPLRANSVGPAFTGGHPLPHQQAAQQQQHHALQALAMAAGGPSSVNVGTMTKLVNELQEQGLAGSKDQLVASLSHLLEQLLSSSPST